MANNDSFSSTELVQMDELTRRMKAVDRSAQSMNVKLQRLIEQNELTTSAETKKSLENPAIPKLPAKEEAVPVKPTVPVNVSKDEDLYFTQPVEQNIEPTESETPTQIAAILPEKTEPVVPITQTQPQTPEPVISDLKESPVQPIVNNIENNTIVTSEPAKIEDTPATASVPGDLEKAENTISTPAQIIEKVVPVTNTIETIEKVVEPSTTPVISEKKGSEPIPSTPTVLPEILEQTKPETAAQQPLNITTTPVQPPPPVVNIDVIESSTSKQPAPLPTPATLPVAELPPPAVQPVIVEAPDVAKETATESVIQEPPAPSINVVTEEPTLKQKEIPQIISEPEVLKPEESLNLADQSLVEMNKNINALTETLKQGHSKLITSIEALNSSVVEILKMLPSLQGGSQQPGQQSRNGRQERVDAANIISNYRQGLGLTTRGYTQNTIFPGGNSIK